MAGHGVNNKKLLLCVYIPVEKKSLVSLTMQGYPGDAAYRLRTVIVNSERKRFLTLDVEVYAYTFVSVVVRNQKRIPCC